MNSLNKQSFSRNYRYNLVFNFTYSFNQFGINGQVTGSIKFKNLKIGHNETWNFNYHVYELTKKQEESIKNQIQYSLIKDESFKSQTQIALILYKKC